MSEQFEARLMECLEALDSREPGAGVDDILARYPEDSAALRMTLGITDSLAVFDMRPAPDAQAASRRKFLAAAASLKQGKVRQPNSAGFFLLRAGAFLLAAFAAGAIPVAASGSALPGDPLYGIKREVENVQLQMAADPASREALVTRINARRVQEVDDLVKDGRSAETEFEGWFDGTHLPLGIEVSGKAIAVPANVHVPDLPSGALVEVTVRVQNGGLELVSISLISGGAAPPPTSTPMPQPTTAPSETPAPEPTKKDDGGEPQTVEPTEDGGHGETSGGEDGTTEVEPTQSEDGGGESTQEPTSGSDDHSGEGSGSGSGGGGGSDDGGGGD